MNLKSMEEISNYDEIDLRDLFLILWSKKNIIFFITSISAILSVIYALSLPNVYSSNALLAPTSSQESLSSKLGQFSGLANIAGFSIPSQKASKSEEAIKRINSFDFFQNYFLANIKLENLVALKEWSAKEDKLIYNESLIDAKNGKWLLDKKNRSQKPSDQEAFKTYKMILSINEVGAGFYSISIEHRSPNIAKKWLDIIILNINESMRDIDKEASLNSINFLNKLQTSNNMKSSKEMIANLLENQIQTLMLASSDKAYVFKIIDSPLSPEKKSGPSRALICILGSFFGLMLSLLVSFIIYLSDPNKLDYKNNRK
ncbi:Wzz/FepE/Etk N-terminal domain-containing protein [Gammaproteobacteria bacterium]|nr:Wzz/FepE/Etk N-terminal domain-containing protein [Gammaproteobacteria bacterium]